MLFEAGVFLGYYPDTGEAQSLTNDQARSVVTACLTAIVELVAGTLDSE